MTKFVQYFIIKINRKYDEFMSEQSVKLVQNAYLH